jgi:aspartyl-tRNA synthetase
MNNEGKLDFAHNPFSHITGGVVALENQDPLKLVSEQYDMVCNGYEILSGSIRNHDADVLVKAFEKVGK